MEGALGSGELPGVAKDARLVDDDRGGRHPDAEEVRRLRGVVEEDRDGELLVPDEVLDPLGVVRRAAINRPILPLVRSEFGLSGSLPIPLVSR